MHTHRSYFTFRKVLLQILNIEMPLNFYFFEYDFSQPL